MPAKLAAAKYRDTQNNKNNKKWPRWTPLKLS